MERTRSPREVFVRGSLTFLVSVMLCTLNCGWFPRRPPTLEFSIISRPLSEKSLAVTAKYGPLPRTMERLRLYKGAVDASDFSCRDAHKRDVSFSDRGGFIEVDLRSVVPPVTFSYTASLGKVGRHGHRGGVYADMVAFDGEHTLILPEAALSATDSIIAGQIDGISISYNFRTDWTAFVPFAEKRGGSRFPVTRVRPTTTYGIYQLMKSCYAFGAFETRSIDESGSRFTLAIDPACKGVYTEGTVNGIRALYARYSTIFGSEPPGFALALLRPDSADGLHVMGGLGPSAIASTFDPGQTRDWELLSHRFFHAFFDSRAPVGLFHKKPQVWLYEGLATYYENIALDGLPRDIRDSLKINVKEGFAALLRRYVYMRLSNPRLALAPMNEPGITSQACTEFLHYTQAPLVVKLLEDQGCEQFGGGDRILRFILGDSRSLTSLEPLFSFAIVKDRDTFGARHLFGAELLPAWRFASGSEDPGTVVRELNEYERNLWAWFREENPDYPCDTFVLDGLAVLAGEAERAGVHFAAPDLQKKVEEMSPTVYRLLMAYALRAKVCGVDMSDSLSHARILGDSICVNRWRDFLGTTTPHARDGQNTRRTSNN